MREDAEEDPGGFMPVNNDFDEQHAAISGDPMLDNQPHTGTGHRIVANDAELRQATLYVSARDGVTSGSRTLNYSPKLVLWEWASDRWRIFHSGTSRTENMPIAKTFIVEGLEHSNALRDAAISAAAGGDSDVAKLTVVGVDSDVDSDNDGGLENPSRNNLKESLEGKTGELGKILSVNDGDTDDDGIPDFADGYNLYGDVDSAELDDVSFTPFILDLRGIVFSNQARLGFFYDQSVPHLVERTGSGTTEDPYLYTPASGLLRLWTKNANERTTSEPLRDGGQFVAPYVDYSLSDFTDGDVEEVTPGVFRLWLEAVRPALTGVKWVHVFADPDGPGNAAGYDISDMVLVTPITTRVLEVAADGTVTPAATAQTSQPSPTFSGVTISVQNLRRSADNKQILGDIVASGSIDDAALDLIPGADGTISSILVLVNGADAPAGAIGTSMTKLANQPSLLAPHDFSAIFWGVLPGIVVEPGWNRIELSATNFYGFSGFAERSVEVIATPPPNTEMQLTFSDDPYLNVSATLDLQYRPQGGAWSAPVTLQRQGAFDDHYFINGAFVVDFDSLAPFDPTAPDEHSAVISVPGSFTEQWIILAEQGANSRVFTGVRDPSDLVTDYRDFVVAPGSSSQLLLSDGGEITRYLLEWEGPTQFADDFRFVSGDLEYQLTEWNDRWLAMIPDTTVPAVAIVLPTSMEPENPVPDNELTVIGAAQFAGGVVVGFGKGIGSMVTGTWDFIKALPGALRDAYVYLQNVGVRYVDGDDFEQERQLFRKIGGASATAADIIWKIWQNDEAVIAAIESGDYEPLNEISVELRLAIEFSVELFEALKAEVAGLSEYEKGKLAGEALFEIVSTVLPLSKLGKATKLKVLLQLGNRPLFANVAGPVGRAYAKLAATGGLIAKLAADAPDNKLLQQFYSIYLRFRKKSYLVDEPWKAVEEMLLRPGVRTEKYGPVMKQLLSHVNKELYTDILNADGTVNLAKYAKIPSYHRADLVLYGWRAAFGIEVHHTAPKDLARKMLRTLPQYAAIKDKPLGDIAWAFLDDMPALPLYKVSHSVPNQMPGVDNFHAILNQRLAALPDGYTRQDLLREMGLAYSDWDAQLGPEVWAVARRWLLERGLE